MAVKRRRLVILGATGTVGRQALEILERARSPHEVVAISAHSRGSELASLAASLPGCATYLTSQDSQSESLLGFLRDGDYDLCLHAMVGAAGLPYSEAVLASGRDLALANKESLVLAGHLLAELAGRSGASIVPVDSEHSAIAQCLEGRRRQDVRRLYLTASGGALRDRPLASLESVTPAEALAHPNWDMGPRITVDSATMMNKALEIIEAQHLFGVPARSVQVLVHRQSVVHSMVELVDGSVIAQMGPPDMTFPIHYALHHPDRFPAPLEGFDPQLYARLSFEAPDLERFPALELGWRAAEAGGASGAVLNAADEVAVEAFLAERISFPEIPRLCAATLDAMPRLPAASLADIHAADGWAREHASSLCPALR